MRLATTILKSTLLCLQQGYRAPDEARLHIMDGSDPPANPMLVDVIPRYQRPHAWVRDLLPRSLQNHVTATGPWMSELVPS